MGFSTGQVAEFSTIFPGVERKSYDEYFSGIPKEKLFQAAAFLLSFNNVNSKFEDWREILKMWFKPENYSTQIIAWTSCENLENGLKGEKLSITYVPALLRFLEWILSKPEKYFQQFQTIEESERNIFKAILCFNEDEFQKMEQSSPESADWPFEQFIQKYFFHYAFPVADIVNYSLPDIAIAQIFKTIIFFDFILNNRKLHVLYDRFLQTNNYKTWNNYIGEVFPIAQKLLSNEREAHTTIVLKKDENFWQNKTALEKLNVLSFDNDSKPDFLHLRAKPLIQMSETEFLVSYPLFAIENLFKSLYFKFKDVNEALPPEKKIKNWRQVYTKEFSESHILYFLLNDIYGEVDKILFTGDEIDKMGIRGGPDTYLRFNEKISIWESKDVLINAEIKASYNLDEIEAELKKKLYYDEVDGKIKLSAVLQLIENVKRILLRKNQFDTDYDSSTITVYPILVLHDTQFKSIGLNNLVNRWFKTELSELEKKIGISTSNVRDLVIINIDFLLLYVDYLQMDSNSLFDLINEYIESTKFDWNKVYSSMAELKSAYGNTLLPFHSFVDFKTDYGYKRNKRNILKRLGEIMNQHAQSLKDDKV